ncbi:MAG: hypothetical protein ABSA75_07320 [Candidatus Bathyarchaeia archaeon]
MSSQEEIEIIAAIETVEAVKQKIKSCKTVEEAIKIIDEDLETAKAGLELDKTPYVLNIPKLEFEILQQLAEKKGKDVEQVLKSIILEQITEKTEAEPILYEEVSVKIPKAVMDLLRAAKSVTGDTPEQDIEWNFVENVRARIDSGQFLPTPKGLVDQYNLNPVFEAILNDPVKE